MEKQSSSKGFAILSTASILCKILSLIYLPVQTALVGNAGNGPIAAGFKLYLFIYALTNAGLPTVISKFVSEQVAVGDYRSSRKIFRISFAIMFLLGAVAAAFTFFASGWLATDFCKMPNAKLMFMVIAPTFLFTSVSCSMRGYFQGRHNMTPTAVSQIVEQIINSVLTVTLEVVLFNYALSCDLDTTEFTAAGSAAATALAALGSALFLSFLYFVVYRNERFQELKNQRSLRPAIETDLLLKRILLFTLPALISCVATSAIDIIDTNSVKGLLMQAGFASLDADALFGIYSTKYQRLMTLATMFVAPLVTAMIPALSSALAKGNKRNFRYKIRESYKLIYIVVTPIVAGLTFLSKPIITVIFPTAADGNLLIIVGSWTALLIAVQSIQSGILISLNRPIISPVNTIIGMAFKVLFNYLLIPVHVLNIYGAIIGNTIAWIIAIALNQYFINRSIKKVRHTTRYLIAPAVSSVIMGVVCLVLFNILYAVFGLIGGNHIVVSNDISVLIVIPLGALLYFTIMIKFGAIRGSDIEKLPMGGKLRSILKHLPFLYSELASGNMGDKP